MKKIVLMLVIIASFLTSCENGSDTIQPIDQSIKMDRIKVDEDPNLLEIINSQFESINGRTASSSAGEIVLNEAIRVDNPELNTVKYSLLVQDDDEDGSFSNIIFQITNGWLYQYKVTYTPDPSWVQNGRNWEQYSGKIDLYNQNNELVSSNISSDGGRIEEGDCYDCYYYIKIVEIPSAGIRHVSLVMDCEPDNSATSNRTEGCAEILGGPAPSGTGSVDDWGNDTGSSTDEAPDWGEENDGGGGGPSGVLDNDCEFGIMINDECIEVNFNMDDQGYKNLTSCEKELFHKHTDMVYTLSQNRDLAHQKTQEIFGVYDRNTGNGHNDCGDAFRHAFFNALNTQRWGAEMAKLWG